jgi:hypothetical protein
MTKIGRVPHTFVIIVVVAVLLNVPFSNSKSTNCIITCHSKKTSYKGFQSLWKIRSIHEIYRCFRRLPNEELITTAAAAKNKPACICSVIDQKENSQPIHLQRLLQSDDGFPNDDNPGTDDPTDDGETGGNGDLTPTTIETPQPSVPPSIIPPTDEEPHSSRPTLSPSITTPSSGMGVAPHGSENLSTIPSRSPTVQPHRNGTNETSSPAPSMSNITLMPSQASIVGTVTPTQDDQNNGDENDDQDIFPPTPPDATSQQSVASNSSVKKDSSSGLSGGGKFGVVLLAATILMIGCYVTIRRKNNNARGSYHRSTNGMREMELSRFRGHDDDNGLL